MEVSVEECVEAVMKLTLIDGSLGVMDFGLTPQFCSYLLKQDVYHHIHVDVDVDVDVDSTDHITQGVPVYPLYKNLASALSKSISSGEFCAPRDQTTQPQQQQQQWNQLIREKGSYLLQVINMMNFHLHVQDPFFSQIKDGLKTVEGRCAVGVYNRMSPGALILLNKCLVLQVQDVHKYASFSEMLKAEGIEKVLPGVKTIEEGVQIYRNFYPEEKERLNGVLAIHITKASSQLSDAMASILRGLSYEGVQQLLGIAHTEGTSLVALPPPRSSLLSSFLSPHNTNVKSSTLTIGARSLAKHVHRSSFRFWGNFCGNDSAKNMHAFDVIRKLIEDCWWLNLHIVPPHGVVFEIRVSDGYGARWSEDGTKFIGFLEPYMENGHSKGWKH